ncbi:helix-turn-helix domain-containing protein [Flavobacterium tructae]|uniref:helix-turn-helix domain-containing protein n=1 Tax=Flavobacterium tructae TaxID=1114873 RepID=UPI0035A91338
MIRKYLFLLSLCLGGEIYAQKVQFKVPDTLQNKDYDYLFNRIEKSAKSPASESFYLKSFLHKAKSEKNNLETVNGYKNYLHRAPVDLKLVYADSMIYAAKNSKDNALIGSAYLSKGIEYYSQKKLNYALDNYLIANNYISKTKDKYLIYKTKYYIAQIKYFLGYYDEAIFLFKQCIDYFKSTINDNNSRGYLNSLHSLGLSYNRTGNYGLCTDINEKGISEGQRLSNNEMQPYFIYSEGVNQYFRNNYTTAIKKINSSLPVIIKKKDFASEAVGYFYIGKSYWDLKKPEMAIPYFKKVDAIFNEKKYIRPDLLNNYELLIHYCKSKKDLNAQLYYIKKLIKADSIINNKYRYLSQKIHKEYDTKELVNEKQKIEEVLHKRKYNDLIFGSIIVLLFLAVLFLIHRHITNKKIYRQRFNELMKKSEISPKAETKNVTNGIEDINQDTLAFILKQLEKFEKDKLFLEKDLTAAKLTVSFGSNVKYLSKIITHYRGKKFVKYINDLKVDYLINILKEDKKIQNYTNKALAEEAGFSTTQRFATAFYSRTGMPTYYFIQELQKEQSNV